MSASLLERGARIVAAALLALVAWWLPGGRRDFVGAVTRVDGLPGAAPRLPAAPASSPLPPAPFVRVVLLDGVNRADALALPAWSELCARGLDLEVDVGFPTVSLPVQVALWTGLTQQQTGILFHSGYPLIDPLGPRAIPAQVPGSIAIAESHPYIVQSLGFAAALPPVGDGKALPPAWDVLWLEAAKAAVRGPARLAFVHVLRVDTAGHKLSRKVPDVRAAPAWKDALATADAALGALILEGDLAHPDARWLVLADHGHVAAGGHGGEEASIRRVRACLAGPGIAPGQGGPLALVDLSRALAESLEVALPAEARGRSIEAALAAPLGGDELVPAPSPGRIVLAGLLVLAGALLTAWALGRRAVLWAPWWWPVALLGVLFGLGAPTLSSWWIYRQPGDTIADAAAIGTYAAAAWTAAAALLAGRAGWRVAIAQVALPVAGFLASLALCGGLPMLWGDAAAPVAPTWTAWAAVLWVITTRGLWAVALALLATSVLPGSGRAARSETRRTGS